MQVFGNALLKNVLGNDIEVDKPLYEELGESSIGDKIHSCG